ncbi:50S ribosomal protein L15 [Rubrimonas cliftonensis]|uniref:Large ribosomal subunit protein uL15 n=1 Tax=Rubrimonas cliftonensis TaxID=89524 RepID=A0A1H4FJ09_9RHOB|nr:50S ribosomal protein L15 [Rubrimonas cliftonensis]SEA97343.1 LSU ribosomal protein L15P [Rubrimonas cliftonensis]
MKLNELADNPGAAKKRKRVGRGPGSGMGKTAGRGIKGQTSRSGVAIKGYEGGQMPLHRRLPKRGFHSLNPVHHAVINLDTIERAFERGALSGDGVIDENVLVATGVVRRVLDGVKLLAKGELTRPVTLELAAASAAAIAAVEKTGGKVEVIDVVARRRAAARAVREAAKSE